MTILSFIVGTLISEVIFVATKVLFFHYLNPDNFFVRIVFILLLVVETIAIVRRMGIINYMESFFIIILWLITMMIVDIGITSFLIGRSFYGDIYYWIGNLAILLSVLFFHKAVHVEVRKANAAKK